MSYDYQIFLLIAPLMSLTVLVATGLIWSKRQRPGGRYLMWFAGAAFGFLLCNVFELVARTEYWTLNWAKSEHVWAAMIPLFWLLFVFDFTGHQKWTRFKVFWPLSVPSLVDVLLTYTNQFHHLIWTRERFFPVGNSLAMVVQHGPMFTAFIIADFLMLLGGIAIVQREFRRGNGFYRRQLIWITIGMVVPIAFSAVYSFHLIHGLNKDFTPLGFAIGAVLFIVAVYGRGFLDISAPSRTRIFDALSDGIVVLDSANRIVDMNREAMAFLALSETDLGMRIELCTQLVPLLEQYGAMEDTANIDVVANTENERRYKELRMLRLTESEDGRNGSLIVIHDITERVRFMDEIKTLRGIVPICARCKKIRDDQGFWQHVEAYVAEHSYAEFSHGLCPVCLDELYPDDLKTDDHLNT